MIKKADIILAVVLIIICAATVYAAAVSGTGGARAVIMVDGELYGEYPLAEDRVIAISEDGHVNTAVISGGKIYMDEADCPDKYCLDMYSASGGIDKTNQTIVCLPNRVIISIEGEGKDSVGDIDALAG